ncbi:hypothetical protein B0A56_00820 [Flavobacterium columnare NBRC 100251 = ATCC 23463]|nr:hypothetical protein B0A56_00820 [Flavobacterium columnare NBRC 100251 = ATCC 23463]
MMQVRILPWELNFKNMRLGKQKTKPNDGTTIFEEMKLARQKALELSKNRKEDKPIKYLLKR